MVKKSIGIVGAGAAGCVCAYYLLKAGHEVTLFDYGSPLRTILPTGGGRCNLAHAEFDNRELAANYPRGEKFLYSVFSKFSTYDTLALFEELGIETYVQDNGRIFPKSNDSREVRNKILDKIKGINFSKECVNSLNKIDSGFALKTDKSEYYFPFVVISNGGGMKAKHINGINHNIITPLPSLVGLKANITNLSGIVIKNVYSYDCNIKDDVLFTHFGLSGPLIYRISSIKARDSMPYKLIFDLYPAMPDLQQLLNENSKKELKNILSKFFPHRFAEYISAEHSNKKGYEINGQIRNLISNKIHNFEVEIFGTDKGEETVTSGGYDLDEINSKTMESKIYPNLYIIGEALNIDGFCGGFNLQNAWSTAYVAASSIINNNL